jgi:hypothetical protein
MFCRDWSNVVVDLVVSRQRFIFFVREEITRAGSGERETPLVFLWEKQVREKTSILWPFSFFARYLCRSNRSAEIPCNLLRLE